MTPIRHIISLSNQLYIIIGQMHIGAANLADDDATVRKVGKLHLQDVATVLREIADRLEKLGESERSNDDDQIRPD